MVSSNFDVLVIFGRIGKHIDPVLRNKEPFFRLAPLTDVFTEYVILHILAQDFSPR
jgi:hypothetical protein